MHGIRVYASGEPAAVSDSAHLCLATLTTSSFNALMWDRVRLTAECDIKAECCVRGPEASGLLLFCERENADAREVVEIHASLRRGRQCYVRHFSCLGQIGTTDQKYHVG